MKRGRSRKKNIKRIPVDCIGEMMQFISSTRTFFLIYTLSKDVRWYFNEENPECLSNILFAPKKRFLETTANVQTRKKPIVFKYVVWLKLPFSFFETHSQTRSTRRRHKKSQLQFPRLEKLQVCGKRPFGTPVGSSNAGFFRNINFQTQTQQRNPSSPLGSRPSISVISELRYLQSVELNESDFYVIRGTRARLTKLVLKYDTLDDKYLKQISDADLNGFHSVRDLEIVNSKYVTGKFLEGLRWINRITLIACESFDADRYCKFLDTMEYIRIDYNTTRELSVIKDELLAHFKNARSVFLGFGVFSDPGLFKLPESIEELSTSSSVANIENPNLITNAGLRRFKNMRKLHYPFFNSPNVTPKVLACFPNLTHLKLSYCHQMNDRGLKKYTPRLEYLKIRSSMGDLTLDGIIQHLKRINTLCLSNVDDVDGRHFSDRHLKKLAKIKLKKLKIKKPTINFSKEAISKLRVYDLQLISTSVITTLFKFESPYDPSWMNNDDD